MTYFVRAAILGAAFLTTVAASDAEPMNVKANLSGSAETPPTSSNGSGTLVGKFDLATRKLTYDVTYSGLTGPAIAAHFHAPAPAGKSAGVEIPIIGSVASPIKGEKTLTEDQVHNLTDGMTYFNIHTAQNKGGEIRGQIMVSK